jgi:hypothetical protein
MRPVDEREVIRPRNLDIAKIIVCTKFWPDLARHGLDPPRGEWICGKINDWTITE